METWQRIHIFKNKDEISVFLIDQWKETSGESIRRRGIFSVALSGGETPIPFYQRLAEEPETLPWERTHIFLADERFLPLDGPHSNYRMLRETLLNKIQIPRENVHPIPVETPNPQRSAEEYEGMLTRFFKLSPGQVPSFDLILLGIGKDGHTASLFPGSPVLDDNTHLVAPIMLDEIRHHRITLTLPVINHGETVIFLVTGETKAAVLRKIIDQHDASMPAAHVHPKSGNLLFLIDREASVKLDKERGGLRKTR
jgi:6-phosphogluconolactonase